jgi:formylglycine-generating enzyme required for sulfatase activity
MNRVLKMIPDALSQYGHSAAVVETSPPFITQSATLQNSKPLDDEDLARILDFNLDNFTQTPVKPLNNQPALQSFEFETAKIRIEELGGLWGHTKVVIEKSRGQSKQFVEDFGDGVNLEMVAIPGGSFLMGALESELESDNNERPQHQVQVPPFYLSKYMITVAQYQTVMRDDSYTKDRADLPMTCEWEKAVAFCEKLSKGLKRNYRLPSEAEWEYACRAGTTTPFYFGETIDSELAYYSVWRAYGRGQKVEYSQSHNWKKVGIYPANAYGLYDMHGNEPEWCADSWHQDYIDAPTDGSAWISSNCNKHVVCSAQKEYLPEGCRSAARKSLDRSLSWLSSGVLLAVLPVFIIQLALSIA